MTRNRHKMRLTLAGRRQGKGFSLIELLVVIFVLTLLMLIAVPASMKFRRSAKRGSSFATLQTISTGIDLYHTEMHMYPFSRLTNNPYGLGQQDWYGAESLAQALVGWVTSTDPDPTVDPDGCRGDGWRLQKPGKVHGPYVDRAQVKFGIFPGFGQPVFMDSFNRPFLYYVFRNGYQAGDNIIPNYPPSSPNPGPGPAFVPPPGVTPLDDPPAPQDQNYAIGTNADWYRKDYMLMSDGADEKWTDYKVDSNTDDVTNIHPR